MDECRQKKGILRWESVNHREQYFFHFLMHRAAQTFPTIQILKFSASLVKASPPNPPISRQKRAATVHQHEASMRIFLHDADGLIRSADSQRTGGQAPPLGQHFKQAIAYKGRAGTVAGAHPEAVFCWPVPCFRISKWNARR